MVGWLVPTLSGGLAGALLTLAGQAFIRRFNRPQPQIRFEADLPGCIVDTPAIVTDGEGRPSLDNQGNRRNVQQRYLRLRIENVGRTFAQNASVCVTQIDFTAAGAAARSFREEVHDLRVSRSNPAETRTTFNLAAGGHRFVVVREGPLRSEPPGI